MFILPELIEIIFGFLNFGNDWLSIRCTCKLFLSISLKVHDQSVNNNKAIKWACRNGNLEVVKDLLNDHRVRSTINSELFKIPCGLGYVDILKELLKLESINPASTKNEPLLLAINHRHIGIVRELLNDKRIDGSEPHNQPLLAACKRNLIPIVRELIAKYPCVLNYGFYNVIEEAFQLKNEEMVEILIQEGHTKGLLLYNSYLKKASLLGYVKVVKILCSNPSIDPSDDSNYAVQFASLSGHLEVVKILLNDERVMRLVEKEHEFLSVAAHKASTMNDDNQSEYYMDIIDSLKRKRNTCNCE